MEQFVPFDVEEDGVLVVVFSEFFEQPGLSTLSNAFDEQRLAELVVFPAEECFFYLSFHVTVLSFLTSTLHTITANITHTCLAGESY